MRRAIVVLSALILAGLAATPPAFAAKRVALVIGNSAYEEIAALKNPKNDAEAIAATLSRLGFDVVKGTDLSHDQFAQTVRDFSRALPGADTAVFYYAGHGLRVGDRNYLAPTNAKLENEADLDFEMIEVETVLRQMESEPRVNIVLLDACRDNPLARNLARSMGTRSAAIGRGLARIETGVGTLIAFATQPDNVALDGDGEHSPFTAALLRHMETPGLDVALLMRQVRQDVIAATSGKQVPWDHSSLTSDFAFNPVAAAPPVAASAPPEPAQLPATTSSGTPTDKPATAKPEQVAVITPPAPVTQAPSEPQMDSAFQDWAVWTVGTGDGRVCFAASKSLKAETYVNVTTWPKDNVQEEVSFKLGVPLKAGSDVKVDIDGEEFVLFGHDLGAFARTADLDKELAERMKSGSKMSISAKTQAGREIRATYSLRGMRAAAKRAIEVCQ
jgi:uncharacterized caspase-like protein